MSLWGPLGLFPHSVHRLTLTARLKSLKENYDSGGAWTFTTFLLFQFNASKCHRKKLKSHILMPALERPTGRTTDVWRQERGRSSRPD